MAVLALAFPIDQYSASVLLGLFSVVNTGLLVYQAVKLDRVHRDTNGARDAAVDAAHLAGIAVGATAPSRAQEGLSQPPEGASDIK